MNRRNIFKTLNFIKNFLFYIIKIIKIILYYYIILLNVKKNL